MKSKVDWGVPDGTEIADYAGNDSWTEFRWRWEFVRRRQDIRDAYMDHARQEFTGDEAMKGSPTNLIWQAEYRNRSYYLSPAQAASIGYGRLPNPLYSEFSWGDGPERSLDARTLVPWHIGQIEHRYITIGIGQVAVVFDPSKPIDLQIEGLREHLLSKRNHNISNDMERSHRGKWIEYLRLIDARVASLSYLECTRCIVSAASAQNEQTARDKHKQALKLQKHL